MYIFKNNFCLKHFKTFNLFNYYSYNFEMFICYSNHAKLLTTFHITEYSPPYHSLSIRFINIYLLFDAMSAFTDTVIFCLEVKLIFHQKLVITFREVVSIVSWNSWQISNQKNKGILIRLEIELNSSHEQWKQNPSTALINRIL